MPDHDTIDKSQGFDSSCKSARCSKPAIDMSQTMDGFCCKPPHNAYIYCFAVKPLDPMTARMSWETSEAHGMQDLLACTPRRLIPRDCSRLTRQQAQMCGAADIADAGRHSCCLGLLRQYV